MLSNGRTRKYQIASPPPSPPLPALTEEDLRSGMKLDFVKEFGLDIGAPNKATGINEDNNEASEPSRDGASSTLNGFRNNSATKGDGDQYQDSGKTKALKLSPKQILDLTSSPKSLPIQTFSQDDMDSSDKHSDLEYETRMRAKTAGMIESSHMNGTTSERERTGADTIASPSAFKTEVSPDIPVIRSENDFDSFARPLSGGRAISTPQLRARVAANRVMSANRPSGKLHKDVPPALQFDETKTPRKVSGLEGAEASPMPRAIPLPPLSLPTYLQLELSSERPSPLYIHRSVTSDFPYESSRVKLERLKNFMLLPPQLEQVLWFGALACMDAWLFSFTILPLRFIKALSILIHSLIKNVVREVQYVSGFIYAGSGRMWKRRRRASVTVAEQAPSSEEKDMAGPFANDKPATERHPHQSQLQSQQKRHKASTIKNRRSMSTPSALSPDHKADILKGFLILLSCTVLMYFDASRMYHGIRGQAVFKLYVIYNVLEVCDRLFSALGQDVLECLFSKESLERKADGRSKVLRPFWLFILALAYNLVHSTSLFYQVITLNVAVNSYSNALLTLLMSNQFVEIKSTVFKKFEKENLFQLTCADVVERFQLWLMLMIIASRNVIETGGLRLGFSTGVSGAETTSSGSSILPRSFTLFPAWTGQVMAPFFLVLGSEMLVDWLKHAYINKFNNVKPTIYGRFLDVLAKDYYSNAFADQNLTRRLGLPVIPLACLFIRASVQTYHMFLATHMPPPIPSTATSLSVESTTSSPATTAALAHIDNLFRRALYPSPSAPLSVHPSDILDLLLPYILPLTTLLVLFLLLLSVKLLLGMALLSFARSRYKSMKEREKASTQTGGRRLGGWGVVEVDEDKRRWIYADDPEGAKRLREREAKDQERAASGTGDDFGRVERYNMVAKRIW